MLGATSNKQGAKLQQTFPLHLPRQVSHCATHCASAHYLPSGLSVPHLKLHGGRGVPSLVFWG
jgi:hypothetical protein